MSRRRLLTLCLFLGASRLLAISPPLRAEVSVALRTDQPDYRVGQPVRLVLSVANNGREAIFGHMLLSPYLPKGLKSAELWYCYESLPCTEFLGSIPNVEYMDMMVPVSELKPGQRQVSHFTVALNPKTNSLVLDAPGDYEFRWVTWGIHRDARKFLRERGEELTASAHVRVLPVPASEAEAFALYADAGLAKVAQYEGGSYVNVIRRAEVNAARKLLERYPDSLYATSILPGLKGVLESFKRQGLATPEDEQLLTDVRQRVQMEQQP